MKITPSDPEDKLHRALETSGLTGEPVELAAGVYRTTRPMVLEGAILMGPRSNAINNWNHGAAVIHSGHGGHAVVMRTKPTGANPVLAHVRLVCYHDTKQGAGSAGIYVEPGKSADGKPVLTAALIDGALIDGAYNGVEFVPGTGQHRVNDLTVRSFRNAGIRCADNTRVCDCHFTGLTYIAGKSHADYVPGAKAPPHGAIGIDGLPAASYYEDLVVEFCTVANVRVGRALNQRINSLLCDWVLGTAIELGGDYLGTDYSKPLLINMFVAQVAPEAKARVWTGPKTSMACTLRSFGTVGNGQWLSTTTPS